MAKKNKTPKFMSEITTPYSTGIINHNNKLKKNTKNGENKNNILSDFEGKIVSLKNNFNPSAMGWSIPKNPTKLGPIRSCIAL